MCNNNGVGGTGLLINKGGHIAAAAPSKGKSFLLPLIISSTAAAHSQNSRNLLPLITFGKSPLPLSSPLPSPLKISAKEEREGEREAHHTV